MTSDAEITMNGPVRLDYPVDHVALITLDSPPMNTLSWTTRPVLADCLRQVQDNLDVRCVIVTGEGRAFSAGGDLKEIKALLDDRERWEHLLSEGTESFALVEDLRVPVIAAINGHCMGGGLEFALWCDIRLASTSAKFQASGVNVGLMTSFARLPLMAGLGRAKHVLLSGYTFDAETMERWGVVTGLYEPDELMPASLELATRIASRAPLSVEATKSAANSSMELSRADNLEVQVGSARNLMATEDHREALAAFLEKREPAFRRV
jgi:enoyl-CoA hydratase